MGQELVPDLSAATFGSMLPVYRVMAARRPRIEAFEVSPVYLMDIGSGHDIVSHDLANTHAQFVNKAKRMSFSTANGAIGCHYTLRMKVGALEGTPTPCVLPESPPLLSVGARCKRKGFSFIWLAGMCPCMVSRRGRVIPP